jgi:hypothetical protein
MYGADRIDRVVLTRVEYTSRIVSKIQTSSNTLKVPSPHPRTVRAMLVEGTGPRYTTAWPRRGR